MKRLLLSLSLLIGLGASAASAPKQKTSIDHVHPLFWWSDMKNPQLQILIHGKNIGDEAVEISHEQKVQLKEVVRPENQNYIILYLDTKGAPAQTFDIKVGKKTVQYELKKREAVNRKSYDASDVVYLLMPDRFANGDTSNDEIAGMLEEEGCNRNVPLARHGGDLAGMTQHLDYLAELGITAIWPTPLLVNDMPKESYHGYAITNFYQTDPRFGSNDEYKQFIEKAHSKGIKIIQDIVFNHCGRQNFLFADMPATNWFNFDGKYVQSSYRTGAVGDINSSAYNRKRMVDGWFVEAMPDLDMRNRLVKDYLIQASIWWVEWAGIDGVRQDTYPYNDFDAMVEWCNRMELEYPGFNIVGEAWINNNVGVSYWQKDSKLAAPRNSMLPTVMDFPLMSLLNYVVDEETDEWDRGYARLYEYLSQDIVFADVDHLLTFLDNHDTDRFQKNPEMAKDTIRYKHALTLLLTLRGIPQLYYGDEIGMAANKSKGDGVLRQDFPGGWPDDKNNAFTKEGRNAQQEWYFRFAQNLLQWRKNCQAVHFGKLTHFVVQKGVYAYARQLEGKTVLVFLNGTNSQQTIDLTPYQEVIPAKEAFDVITHQRIKLEKELSFNPREIFVLDFCIL